MNSPSDTVGSVKKSRLVAARKRIERAASSVSPRTSEVTTYVSIGAEAGRIFTGRYIVVFASHSTAQAMAALRKTSGLHVASSSDFGAVADMPQGLGSALYLESLGIAIADAPPDQMLGVGVSAANGVQVVPERHMFVSGGQSLERAYLEGYRAGVDAMAKDMLQRFEVEDIDKARALTAASIVDATWNLARTGVLNSHQTGKGIKLAILDTGYDQHHPDLIGRVALSNSFVPGSSIQDAFGHGTHCVGIAAGITKPVSEGPRYGCAGGVELLVGKVLGDDGRGDEGWVLNGLNWALEQGADVVSMSVEGPYDPVSQVLPQYEAVGRRALNAGRLIVAAGGNYSVRPLLTRPVASPACASTIMAVGAIGPDDRVAAFSCASTVAGRIDIAAPGVAIESSYPTPRTRRQDSGTSMAAPLVAGIAALHMEASPGLRGQALWDTLTKSASALPDAPGDIGAGCVAAP